MKLVLDSNVALKTVLPEADSPRAIQLLVDFKQGLHDLLSPDIFPVEVGHALTRAERQRRIQPPDGWRFWNATHGRRPCLAPAFTAHASRVRFVVSDARRSVRLSLHRLGQTGAMQGYNRRSEAFEGFSR